jgi:cytochrome c oxidase subunit 4
MAQRTISAGTYLLVCAVLVLLTFVTVAISFLHLPSNWHFALGMTIGACKAALVVLFFMHAWISGKVTWLVIIISGCWLGILFVLTLTDYMSRGAVPLMFGH